MSASLHQGLLGTERATGSVRRSHPGNLTRLLPMATNYAVTATQWLLTAIFAVIFGVRRAFHLDDVRDIGFAYALADLVVCRASQWRRVTSSAPAMTNTTKPKCSSTTKSADSLYAIILSRRYKRAADPHHVSVCCTRSKCPGAS